jgi:fluoride ion exporter CrcB/FEX
MIPLLDSAIYGLIGGIVRGVVGFVKSKQQKRKFNVGYFVFTIAVSAVIGLFAGMLMNSDYKISLLAGYAGIDLIESIYKIGKKKL